MISQNDEILSRLTGCRHLVTRLFLTQLFLTRVTLLFSDLSFKRAVSPVYF